MGEKTGRKMKVRAVFLLGSNPSFIRKDGMGFEDIHDASLQESKTDGILREVGIEIEKKVLVRKEEDLNELELNCDAFIIFAHCLHRFPQLITLAQTGIPLVVSGEEGALGEALDLYQYLAEYENVRVACDYEEIRRSIRVVNAAWRIKRVKVCLFDTGERSLNGAAWYKNPLLKGEFNTQRVDVSDLKARYENVERREAKSLAKVWGTECTVLGPTMEDIVRSARVYIAMKGIIEETGGDVSYVLWCGQFNDLFGTKMCLAIAKLNDAGYLTGCWRGENFLPMLILHELSGGPIFFGEVHMYRDGVLSLRHCAVPTKIASSPAVLRPWRDRKGTVATYCEMARGEVTLVNSGTGERMVVMKGEVVESKDLGGDNCRTTVWVRIDERRIVHRLTGREFAMVYGNYTEEAGEVGRLLGIEVEGS